MKIYLELDVEVVRSKDITEEEVMKALKAELEEQAPDFMGWIYEDGWYVDARDVEVLLVDEDSVVDDAAVRTTCGVTSSKAGTFRPPERSIKQIPEKVGV